MRIRTSILLAALIAALAVGQAVAADKPTLSPATESLFLAIRTNSMDAVRRSLLAGADVEAENEDGRTPIDLAIDRGHFDIAHYLLAWRKHATRPAKTTPEPPPVTTEVAPAPTPQTMPATQEPPSVLSPTPSGPVAVQPLSPTPMQSPPAATPPVATPPTAAATPPAPRPAPPATPPTPEPAPKVTTAAPVAAPPSPPEPVVTRKKESAEGDFFAGFVRFFTGKPAEKPEAGAETAATPPEPKAVPAEAAPKPKTVAPLPATGKITPPSDVAPKSEGFFEGLARFFTGKSDADKKPAGASKPQSSLEAPPASPGEAAPPAVATTPAPAVASAAPPATDETTPPPVRDSLLDHIAKVLAESQTAESPPAATATPAPAAQPAPASTPAEAPVATPAEADTTSANSEPSILDDIARLLSDSQTASEEPPRPTPAAAPEPAPEPAPTPAVATAPPADAAPASTPEPATPPRSSASADAMPPAKPDDGGQLLGRITEFFTVSPEPAAPQPAATPKKTAMATPRHADPLPRARTRSEPWLGANLRLGMRRPPDETGVCVDKAEAGAVFCIEPVNWPAKIAGAFDVRTAYYRGRKAVVRYDDGAATQFHALFPTANYRAVVDYFTSLLGPPGYTGEHATVAIGQPDRDNHMTRWLGPKPGQDGSGDTLLEVREYDDLRWSSPPDLDHGVARLYHVGGDTMFRHVSWSDFLLARMRQSRN